MLNAAALIQAVKASGIRFVVALPDRTTSEHVLKPLLADPEMRVVQVCKEDEGVSICAGLHAAGQRALLLMQHTGLLDSVNALRGVAYELMNPVCMMVGLLQKEPGVAPARSKRYGLRIVEPVLEALQIDHLLIDETRDVEKVAPAIEAAYGRSMPVVLLIGTEPHP
ncbi:MAG: decarboxylase [Burkholderiales bacterium]|nr:decarboxylase [Burkholderiales bacterium]